MGRPSDHKTAVKAKVKKPAEKVRRDRLMGRDIGLSITFSCTYKIFHFFFHSCLWVIERFHLISIMPGLVRKGYGKNKKKINEALTNTVVCANFGKKVVGIT